MSGRLATALQGMCLTARGVSLVALIQGVIKDLRGGDGLFMPVWNRVEVPPFWHPRPRRTDLIGTNPTIVEVTTAFEFGSNPNLKIFVCCCSSCTNGSGFSARVCSNSWTEGSRSESVYLGGGCSLPFLTPQTRGARALEEQRAHNAHMHALNGNPGEEKVGSEK